MRAIGPAGEDLLPRAKRSQAVLAYLVLARGDRVARSRVAGLIWDTVGERQARDSLRHALRDISRAGSWRLHLERETVRLDAAACWVDALETPEEPECLLDDLHGTSASFDQWLLSERVRFEIHWQTKLESDLNQLIDNNAPPELRAAAARQLLNFMPTHEHALRRLMTAFRDMGDCAQAVREFERFRQIAAARLGIPPSEQTTALYTAIRIKSQIRFAQASTSLKASDRAATEPQGPATPRDLVRRERSDTLPHRGSEPTVAVLPFLDISGKAERPHLAEGLVEDLVEALSRVPGLFVTSRLSAAAFTAQHRSAKEIGGALGVRYLLSGSVRAAEDRVRFTVELTDAENGSCLWSSRYDEYCVDLLLAQDRVTV
jgi:TolB-like protein